MLIMYALKLYLKVILYYKFTLLLGVDRFYLNILNIFLVFLC